MFTSYYSAALLLALPLTSIAHPAPPDSSAVTPRHRLLTVSTFHVWSPLIPSLGYEALVRPRWGVRANLGAHHASERYTYTSSYNAGYGTYTIGTRQYRQTVLAADVSLNYYLQARKPALLGWFAGVGVITVFSHSRYTDDKPAYESITYRRVSARPTLRAGRHWALGQRWLLDTNVAVAIWHDPGRVVFLQEFIGLGAGYRF